MSETENENPTPEAEAKPEVETSWSLTPRITRMEAGTGGADGAGYWIIHFSLPGRTKHSWISKIAHTPLELTTILEAVGSMRQGFGRTETTEEALARGIVVNHCPTRWASGAFVAGERATAAPKAKANKKRVTFTLDLEDLLNDFVGDKK